MITRFAWGVGLEVQQISDQKIAAISELVQETLFAQGKK
jgi:hypothetical protein